MHLAVTPHACSWLTLVEQAGRVANSQPNQKLEIGKASHPTDAHSRPHCMPDLLAFPSTASSLRSSDFLLHGSLASPSNTIVCASGVGGVEAVYSWLHRPQPVLPSSSARSSRFASLSKPSASKRSTPPGRQHGTAPTPIARHGSTLHCSPTRCPTELAAKQQVAPTFAKGRHGSFSCCTGATLPQRRYLCGKHKTRNGLAIAVQGFVHQYTVFGLFSIPPACLKLRTWGAPQSRLL